MRMLGKIKTQLLIITLMAINSYGISEEPTGGTSNVKKLEQIRQNRDNPEVLAGLLPIIQCSFTPSRYESILMTRLRDKESSTAVFRDASRKIGELLVGKVIDYCFPADHVTIETPVTSCVGERLAKTINLVSIMRSGDALLDAFMYHFPEANVSKILVQRDEETAEAHFIYLKFSPTIADGQFVVITEPMIATGGTLEIVISLLKDKGVREENIIIASICAAPEGLLELSEKHPRVRVVMTVLDDRLNEKKYIVPGLGDFGDRYFGITKAE